jgi:hypothetical protein
MATGRKRPRADTQTFKGCAGRGCYLFSAAVISAPDGCHAEKDFIVMVYNTLEHPTPRAKPAFYSGFLRCPGMLSTKPVKALLHQLVSIYS